MAEQPLNDFGKYLGQSLQLMELEAPDHFTLLCQRMAAARVDIAIGDDALVQVRFNNGKPWVRSTPPEPAEVTVGVAQFDLDALLRGDLTVEQAIASERLRIQGPLETVLTLLESLSLWFHGAMRCPSLPTLHARYLVHGDSTARTLHL